MPINFFIIGAWESTEHTVLTNLCREGQEIPNLNASVLMHKESAKTDSSPQLFEPFQMQSAVKALRDTMASVCGHPAPTASTRRWIPMVTGCVEVVSKTASDVWARGTTSA